MKDFNGLHEKDQNFGAATVRESSPLLNLLKVRSSVIPTSESISLDPKKSTQASLKETYMSFPLKLYNMLEKIEQDGLASVVSWQPHGRCFLIHKPKQFALSILPIWFQNLDTSSFQRELELHGFERVMAGRDKGGYYSPLFLRQKRSLCLVISRRTIKAKRNRKISSLLGQRPNFYMMPFLPNADCRKKNIPKKSMLVMDPC